MYDVIWKTVMAAIEAKAYVGPRISAKYDSTASTMRQAVIIPDPSSEMFPKFLNAEQAVERLT